LPVAASGVETVLDALLRRLREGPTDEQRRQGLGSAFGPDVGLSLVAVTDGAALVEVTPAEQVPPADRLPLAVGQVVLTLTSVEGVERVVLQQDGQPVPAPLPGGELTSAPLTPADYDDLLAPSVTRPEKAVPLPSDEPT
jgi:spore germination protein GerM